jgi:hypothetical protein
MTYEKQDILEDFYSGNTKILRVTVYDKGEVDGLKDLSNAELTYTIVTRDKAEVVLRKSSYRGEHEIKVLSKGLCDIYLRGADTVHIHGTFRHHLNVVDQYGDEATAFTGLIRIYPAPAKRFREQDRHAYLEGTAE